MIFYFSGTGNSHWVAEQIAALTGDTAYDIVKVNTPGDISKEQQIGFVFPVYAWGAAEPMRDFASRLPKTSAFTFGICTCGGNAGNAMKQFSKSYPLASSYSLIMPNNYIVGSDTDDDATILKKIQEARAQLEIISQEILSRKAVYRVTEGSMAFLKSNLANWGFEHFARNTKPFHINENCVGCGLCEKDCPAGTISINNGKPVWKEKCYQCLRCINSCPEQAIEYGSGTPGRKRYTLWQHLSK